MTEEIRPLGGRVLARLVAEESFTRSGLVIPDTAREKPQRAEVVAVGDDEETIKVAPGDLVLFAKYAGAEVKIDDADYLILDASDLLAVVTRTAAEAA
jgi:chaperonin GroES